jgi:hypothetical protein
MITIYWSDGPDHTLLIDPAELAPGSAGTPSTSPNNFGEASNTFATDAWNFAAPQ